VATGEEDNKKEEVKGFAGLSSLVSDVDATTPPPVPKKPASSPSAATSAASRPTPPSVARPPHPQGAPQPPYKPPGPPGFGWSTGKWWIGIAVVAGFFWLMSQISTQAPAYAPPERSTTPTYSLPVQPQVPSRPVESKPPTGEGRLISREQIAYCVAEDIRMAGARAAVNNYNASDVDRFNAMVADYNSRCSSFRYRQGALESVRSNIEPYRSQLYSEGQQRVTRYPSQGSISTPSPALAQTINTLPPPPTYAAGPFAYTGFLNTQLAALSRQGSGRNPPYLPLAGRQSRKSSCAADVSLTGSADHNSCLPWQLARLW
jgi:hypothetical protein